MENRDTEAKALAQAVLQECRNTLLVHLPYLSHAVAQLPCVSNDKMTLGTDGQVLYYQPYSILLQYQIDPRSVARDYLHCLLHCVFLHPFVGETVKPEAWSLACDAAVEYLINDLNLPAVQSKRGAKQAAFQRDLKRDFGTVTAERLYHFICEQHMTVEDIHELRTLFNGDEHGLWFGRYDPDNAEQMQADQEKVWKDISRRIRTQTETVAKDQNGSSSMAQALLELHRPKVSYETFLRKFGTIGESLHTSTEEFDNAYYLYGMERYGNMPLVEYLEYFEQKKIRDFVIAIDTSGSVRGDTVQSFVQKTFEILQQEKRIFLRSSTDCFSKPERVRHWIRLWKKSVTQSVRGKPNTRFRRSSCSAKKVFCHF